MDLPEQLTDKMTAPGKRVKEHIHSGKQFHKPKYAHAFKYVLLSGIIPEK